MSAVRGSVRVDAESGTRLAQLAASYAEAKDTADAAAERLKSITDAIKLELIQAAPNAGSIALVAPDAVLTLNARTSRRLDIKRIKAELPRFYDQYSVPVTSWVLKRARP